MIIIKQMPAFFPSRTMSSQHHAVFVREKNTWGDIKGRIVPEYVQCFVNFAGIVQFIGIYCGLFCVVRFRCFSHNRLPNEFLTSNLVQNDWFFSGWIGLNNRDYFSQPFSLTCDWEEKSWWWRHYELRFLRFFIVWVLGTFIPYFMLYIW